MSLPHNAHEEHGPIPERIQYKKKTWICCTGEGNPDDCANDISIEENICPLCKHEKCSRCVNDTRDQDGFGEILIRPSELECETSLSSREEEGGVPPKSPSPGTDKTTTNAPEGEGVVPSGTPAPGKDQPTASDPKGKEAVSQDIPLSKEGKPTTSAPGGEDIVPSGVSKQNWKEKDEGGTPEDLPA
ncbi:hypothetical protein NHQ30_002163 [Ciborinia camelliae]|nr:hypothetical protein NHQ30_002163 [Ciborinia camelliae]